MAMTFALFQLIHTEMTKNKVGKKKWGRRAKTYPGVKTPGPKPGDASAATKQLTAQLCIMYLPFPVTFAAFIISSCWRRKLDNAAVKDWCMFHRVQAVVGSLLLPRWCFQTKHTFGPKFHSNPTGWCHVEATLYVAGALKPVGPSVQVLMQMSSL